MRTNAFIGMMVMLMALVSETAYGNKKDASPTESLYGEWWLVGWNEKGAWCEVDANYVSHRHLSIEIPEEGVVMAYSMVNEIVVGKLTVNGNRLIFSGGGCQTEIECDIMENLFFEGHIRDIRSYLLEGNLLRLYYTDSDYFVFTNDLDAISTHAVQAQRSWAMATIEEGRDWPTFTEFHCVSEKGVNGMDYWRIYDETFRIRQEPYNPVKLRYGYRMSDKHIFVYNFETEEERLAFDFTLSAGDHFSTCNGMEWEVEEVMDTLVNMSYLGQGESCTKRLLKVHSVDGRHSDQWLEDFGSFANHFMLLPMEESKQTQTLWMEYDEGHYLVRELSSDPLFTHDSGMPDENAHGTESISCTYNDGTLTVERAGDHSPNREYSCFHRIGDDLYCAYVWELNPATGADYTVWHRETAYYHGLPAPQSGQYMMHFYMGERPSDIANPTNANNQHEAESATFDLTGRKVPAQQTKGIYIRKGKKVMGR